MDDANFIFSLYPRDLIYIKSKNELKSGYPKELFMYFKGANVANANMSVIAHDNSFELGSLGIQRLELIEKCQVDILGNISVVRHENRQGFH